ncbi:MAG TPA: aminoacyl-tRNA hydrolase [Patescibacteria group bacterium]|jgi:PTH1 family peptidyl-tRNA hydrolase|nr:aminoacyl-tRNA hydrolase [Patescibacteria group bacterium]
MDGTQAGETQSNNKYLVAGLGNPGRRYRRNRHNIGFMVIDRLAETAGIQLRRVQSNAIIGDGFLTQQSLILAKPQTYMNKSGTAIASLTRYYRIPLGNLLVIYDEIDLPFGMLRFREQGGSGGHNGMKSIIDQIGQEFPRLRLGVDRPPGYMEPADYVLQNFSDGEASIVDEMINQAVAAIQVFLNDGIEIAMTRFNGQIT